MTLSEIRRRIAQAVADDWTPGEPPEPSHVIQRIARAGFRLPTFARLGRYLNDIRRQDGVPDAESMVLALLPWAECDHYRELLRWDFRLSLPVPRCCRFRPIIKKPWAGFALFAGRPKLPLPSR